MIYLLKTKIIDLCIPKVASKTRKEVILTLTNFGLKNEFKRLKRVNLCRRAIRIAALEYSQTSLIWALKGQGKVSVLESCLYWRVHYDVIFNSSLTVWSFSVLN